VTPGLHISSIRLKKVVCFDNAAFKIEPGVSVIYGLNRTNARTSGNGNGAGKSAFFSQIGEMLYEAPIVGEKQDAVKGGTRVLNTLIQGRKVSIIKTNSKLDIKIDGKSRFRTKPMAKAWMAKNLPINEEEFNTYVHLDARIPHPLVMGSSTERRRFFTSFFGLDKMDMERKLFTAELQKLGRTRAAYTEVLAEYKTTKAKALAPDVLAKLVAQVKAKEEELSSLNEKHNRIQSVMQTLSFESSAQEQLKELFAILPEVTEESFEELEATTRQNYKQDKADLDEALAWEQYQRDTEHYTKAFNALPEDAIKLINKLGLAEAKKKCSEKAQTHRLAKDELEDLQERLAVDMKIVKRVPEKPDTQKPKVDEGELRANMKALEHQLEHARTFKTGTCHTCGQTVKIKDTSSIKEEIKAIEVKLRKLNIWGIYENACTTRSDAKVRVSELTKEIAEVEAKIKATERYAVLREAVAELPRKPAKFEGKRLESKIKQRMVDEDKERLQLLKFLRPNLDMVIAVTKLSDKQRQAKSLGHKLQAKVNSIHEELSKLRAQLEVNSMLDDTLNRLRKRLREMKAELVDEEALKLLVEGYSDKGMKRRAIQAIGSRLMLQVNKYSRVVFPEDFTFDLKWESSKLSLLVHRKIGKKTVSSDVRKLSGAECKLFTIVLVLALLTFVPPRKRCNLLILDEPTANFSPETTKAFMDLLPVLNQVIPSIIIITPKSDERYEGATNWTVVKTKGVSVIVPGHPSEIKKG
jgi:DNA repair exonuclease SbcCD ATPase subunit